LLNSGQAGWQADEPAAETPAAPVAPGE